MTKTKIENLEIEANGHSEEIFWDFVRSLVDESEEVIDMNMEIVKKEYISSERKISIILRIRSRLSHITNNRHIILERGPIKTIRIERVIS